MPCCNNLHKSKNMSTIIKISDELWDKICTILPYEKPINTIGRPIIPYRKVLDGILYVLRTGCQWKMLPKEHGSGSTCHRRFQEWNGMNVFKNIWIKLLKIYDEMIGINWTWQSIDSISIKSPLGGGAMTVGNNPTTDRSKLGQAKRHILTDKKGIPLSAVISSAKTHDIKLVTADVVDNVVIRRPSFKYRNGKRRIGEQQHLCLDKGYNSENEEQELIKRGYVLHIPIKKKKKKGIDNEKDIITRKIPDIKKYSPKRWVVERTNSWHNRFRKLFTRYEKKSENYLGLIQFSCCIMTYRKIFLGQALRK